MLNRHTTIDWNYLKVQRKFEPSYITPLLWLFDIILSFTHVFYILFWSCVCFSLWFLSTAYVFFHGALKIVYLSSEGGLPSLKYCPAMRKVFPAAPVQSSAWTRDERDGFRTESKLHPVSPSIDRDAPACLRRCRV